MNLIHLRNLPSEYVFSIGAGLATILIAYVAYRKGISRRSHVPDGKPPLPRKEGRTPRSAKREVVRQFLLHGPPKAMSLSSRSIAAACGVSQTTARCVKNEILTRGHSQAIGLAGPSDTRRVHASMMPMGDEEVSHYTMHARAAASVLHCFCMGDFGGAGRKMYPHADKAAIDSILVSHPGIREAAPVGLRMVRGGQIKNSGIAIFLAYAFAFNERESPSRFAAACRCGAVGELLKQYSLLPDACPHNVVAAVITAWDAWRKGTMLALPRLDESHPLWSVPPIQGFPVAFGSFAWETPLPSPFQA